MSDAADTSMEGPGGDGVFRDGGIVWTSTQTGTETINDILKYSSKPAQRLKGASTGRPQVELSSTDTPLLQGSSSGVPYFYAASPHSFSSFDSASVATAPSGIRAGSGSVSTISSTSSLKPLSNGSSADLKRIRPSQRRAFLEASTATESSTSSRASIEENERVNRRHTHSQINPEVGTPMRPIDNLDTLHNMLQSISKSWNASNASSSTASTRSAEAKSSKPPSRVVTTVPSTSKTLQTKGPRKVPLSSPKIRVVLQKTTSAKPAPLPSQSIPPHIPTSVAGVEAIENPLKEAVAKLESPARARPRKSIGSGGSNLMPPPPPPLPLKPLPSEQQPHCPFASTCAPSVSDMSFELEATEKLRSKQEADECQTESPHEPEKVFEQGHGPAKKEDMGDAEDSYDDLSFVDVDGLMDVDLEEWNNASPAVEQHALCTTQGSNMVPPPQPAFSGENPKRLVASAMQELRHSKPVIETETLSSIFSTPIQVAPFAPDISTPKTLGMRRVNSGPISGFKASNSSRSVSSAKPGTAPPCGHSSTRGSKPFKVPWARNGTSMTTLEPSAVPEVRRPAPKRRGVMDLDTSTESSFSFDDMDPEEVEQLLSQIGA